MTIILSPFSTLLMPERRYLLSAALVSLPLAEAIGRLGCHSAGCCGSNRRILLVAREVKTQTRQRPNISAPLLSSSLAFMVYLGIITKLLTGTQSLPQATALSIFFQGAIRMTMEVFRNDVARIKIIGVKPTVVFAMAQVLGGLTYLLYILPIDHTLDSHLLRSAVDISLPTEMFAGPSLLGELIRTFSYLRMEEMRLGHLLVLALPVFLIGVTQGGPRGGTKGTIASLSPTILSDSVSDLQTQACSDARRETTEKPMSSGTSHLVAPFSFAE